MVIGSNPIVPAMAYSKSNVFLVDGPFHGTTMITEQPPPHISMPIHRKHGIRSFLTELEVDTIDTFSLARYELIGKTRNDQYIFVFDSFVS